MKKGTSMFYRVLWQDVSSRSARLLRCFVILVLCVTFLFVMVEVKYQPVNYETNDYFLFMKIADPQQDGSKVLSRILTLEEENSVKFSTQVYVHANNGDGVDVVGLDDASYYGGAYDADEMSEKLTCRVSNDLIPYEYDLRADEITLQFQGKTFSCIGKANYLSSALLETVPAEQMAGSYFLDDFSLSVNPDWKRYSENEVYLDKPGKHELKDMYEEFIQPFRPCQVFLSLRDYCAAELPVYGVALLFDEPLAGAARENFLAAFEDVAWEECFNESVDSVTRMAKNLENFRLMSIIRLVTVVTLALFLQLVSWKIWIAELKKLMDSCHMMGLSFARQMVLMTGFFLLVGVGAYLVGFGAARLISLLALEKALRLTWNPLYCPIVLVVYLAGLLLYSLYCLCINVWRIGRKEVVL